MNQHSRCSIQARYIIDMAAKKCTEKGFLLRVDPETMALVERWAADEFRSVNGQLQWIINDALIRYKRRTKSTKTASSD
jgi:hypothetical protein